MMNTSIGLSPGRGKYPVGIIVQARMGSSRLPGKVLKELLPNITMLEIVFRRLLSCTRANKVILATTYNPDDDILAKMAKSLGIGIFRGSEEDVLSRYYGAACKYGLKTIVRVTSDCPALEPSIIDSIICQYINSHHDYISNILQRTFPRGMDTEVFSFNALQKAQYEAISSLEREHVTTYIYGHPDIFRIGHHKDLISNHSHLRLTVDTPEDLEVARHVFKSITLRGESYMIFGDSYDIVVDILQKLGDRGLDVDKQSKYSSNQYFDEHRSTSSTEK